MPAVVACPKCKAKYTLPDSLVGRPVKCKACSTMFKVGGSPNAAAPKTNPQATAQQKAAAQKKALANQARKKELARLGLDGPIGRQPDIFAAQASLGQDPLANHVVHDPGFDEIDLATPEVEDAISTNDENALFDNPALRELKRSKKRNVDADGEPNKKKRRKGKKKSRRERLAGGGGSDDGFEFSGIGNVVMGFIILAIGVGGTIYSINNPDPEGYSTYYYGAIAGGLIQMVGGAAKMMS